LLLYQVAQVRGNLFDSAQLLADSTVLVAVRKADTEQTLAEGSTDLLEQHSILRMPVSKQDYDRAQALFVNTPETAGLGSAPSCVIWDTNAQDWTFASIRRSIGLNSLHRMCISNMPALSPALSGSSGVAGVGCFYYLECHTTSRQGIFAVKQAAMDCEGFVGGSSRWDACGVCKGDNSTCAGCDNLPNLIVDGVKLTKECSGHGQCRGLVCSCCADTENATTDTVPVVSPIAAKRRGKQWNVWSTPSQDTAKMDTRQKSTSNSSGNFSNTSAPPVFSAACPWYGETCHRYCTRDPHNQSFGIHCSAHGYCGDNGRKCTCDEGWADGDDPASMNRYGNSFSASRPWYPTDGLCSRYVGVIQHTPHPVPRWVYGIIGTLFCLFIVFLVLAYRRRQEAQRMKADIEDAILNRLTLPTLEELQGKLPEGDPFAQQNGEEEKEVDKKGAAAGKKKSVFTLGSKCLRSPFSKGKEQEKKKTGVKEEVSAASSSQKKHLSNRKKQWKQGEIIVFNTADILDDRTIDNNVNSYLTASKSERLSADAGSGVSVRRRDQNKARAVDRVTKAGGDPAFLETFHRENADDLVRAGSRMPASAAHPLRVEEINRSSHPQLLEESLHDSLFIDRQLKAQLRITTQEMSDRMPDRIRRTFQHDAILSLANPKKPSRLSRIKSAVKGGPKEDTTEIEVAV
jgi:hypothetical protein